jgi:ABC-type transport system substrate-binding protein
MITIDLDGLPKDGPLVKSMDYNGLIVYSAVSDPLFKYNHKTDVIEPNACCNMIRKKNSSYYLFELRNDLFYSTGKKIGPIDYQEAIEKLLHSDNPMKFYFKSIKYIGVKDHYLIIQLKYKDINFYKYLSYYIITPEIDGIYSGPYSFQEKKKEYILMKRNNYFRHITRNEKIIFNVIGDSRKEIEKYYRNELNMTCNTIFPIEFVARYKKDLRIYPNFIIMSLNFTKERYLSKKYYYFRKAILYSINRETISKSYDEKLIIANDFYIKHYNNKNDMYFNKEKAIINKERAKKYWPDKIILAYDDYYPNEKIASMVGKNLNEIGLNVIFKKTNFFSHDLDQSIDIKLILNFPIFVSNLAFYISPYFLNILRLDKIKYNAYTRLCTRLCKKNDNTILEEMNKIIMQRAVKIPIVKMYNIYLCSRNLYDFDYRSMNFESI